MKKISIITTLLAIIALFVGQTVQLAKAAGSSNTHPIFYVASSTVISITTTSQRILATSTPTQRVAASIQPINCTTGSSGGIFMNANRDVAATTSTGPFAFASTTNLLGDYMNGMPVVQGPVQGITGTGTCTVIVTEWRLIQ